MITTLCLQDREKILKGVGPEEIKNLLKNRKTIVWMDLKNPTKKEFDVIADIFKFHPLTIEDAQHLSELPKIDVFEDYIFIVFHKLDYDQERDQVEMKEYDIFLSRNYIVTIHFFESENINAVMDICSANPKFFSRGSDFVLHKIIDNAVDKYLPMVNRWDERLEELEDDVITGKTEGIMEKILPLKRDIAKMKNSLGPQRDVILKLSRSSIPFISQKTSIYFMDVYDHIMRLYSTLEMDRDLTSGIFDAYLSTISNRMNEIMKALTLIATIFIPLTFVTGLYGMNFEHMPEIRWEYGYVFAWCIILSVVTIMLFYFRRRKWL
jgi:magnesium transporter